MPRTRSIQSSLLPLVQDFAARLSSFVEQHSVAKARQAVLDAIGAAVPAVRRGRPPGSRDGNGIVKLRKARKKAPIQLCPVPGCKNRAAPVFGMVCADHKSVSKQQIKKYREARRKQKANGKKQ